MRYGINLIKIWTLKLQTPLGYAKGSLKNRGRCIGAIFDSNRCERRSILQKSGLLAGEQCQETGIGYYKEGTFSKLCEECR